MSKSTFFFNKKNNPLAAVINKRNVSPNTSARINHQKGDNSFAEGQTNSKLYTFCSSQNNTHKKEENDENKENTNLTTRQRKVSLSNIKGKIYQPSGKKIAKQGNSHTNQKERKNFNNMSVTCINSAFDKKKNERMLTTRGEEKKLNISISINPKTLREADDSSQKDSVSSRSFAGRDHKTPGKRSCEFKPLGKPFFEHGKQKIILEEEELKKFTQKFAHELFISQQKINYLERRIQEYETKQNQWQLKSKQYEQYLCQAEKEKEEWTGQIKQLKSKIAQLSSDNEYYLIAKNQSREVVKEQESQINQLLREIGQLRENLFRNKEENYIGRQNRIQVKEMNDTIRLLTIQNDFLRKQLEINDFYHDGLTMQKPFNPPDNSPKMLKLSQENKKLKSQLKDSHLEQIYVDIYKKTIEQCTARMTSLQQQNQSLKNRFKFDCRSIQNSQERTEFQYKLESNPYQRSATSPSQVQCIWKRQNTESAESKDTSQFNLYNFNRKHLNTSSQY